MFSTNIRIVSNKEIFCYSEGFKTNVAIVEKESVRTKIKIKSNLILIKPPLKVKR